MHDRLILDLAVVTPVAAVHRVPLVGGLVRAVEHRLADLPGARGLGGFVVAVAQKR